jgi:hypothetical protein
MRPKVYQVLRHCIEEGIDYGCKLAHADGEPSKDELCSTIYEQVMFHIDEFFVFEEEV